MVTIMTALWFRHLRAEDRVAVKPHASPVLHAINYLLGGLDESYLTTLRQFGGLQSYPSRAKDPDAADYSTGSWSARPPGLKLLPSRACSGRHKSVRTGSVICIRYQTGCR